ncbi:MAG: S-layer homology domain-containing protein, partial [Peptostreptococcaceae bacterium]|nr:S-layer homology domain-containing protein [Peptostreptococcaceae bacterium]
MKKRKSFTAIALGLLLSCCGNAVLALSFEDMPQNWAKLPLERAVQNKILVGHKGKIMPYDNVTRAQFASILSSLLHYSSGESPKFSDVTAANWYYDSASKLVSRNILELDNGNFYPSKEMTREEVFTAIGKALQMRSSSTAALEIFADFHEIKTQAHPYLAALVEKGYVGGYANRLHPNGKINRAELAVLLDKLFPTHLARSGEYTSLSKGNVLVRAKNIVLKDLTIEGSLIFAEGFSPNDVTLINTLVKGDQILLAGVEIEDEATPLGPVNPNLIAQNRPSRPADRVVEVDDDRDSGSNSGGGGSGGNTPSPNVPSPNTP